MMMIQVNIFIVVFAVLSSVIIADDPCRFVNGGDIIDLTSLGRTDGMPAFPDKIPPTGSNYKYSYNPCRPFSEGAECRDVAACQVSMDGLFQFTLGKHESTTWNSGGGLGASPYVTYSSGDKKVRVDLDCRRDEILEFEALGEDPINNYRFRLSHKCACWNGCGGGPPPPTTQRPGTSSKGGGGGGGGGSGGISGGTVFIIILLVLLVVYFVGFGLFYRIRHEKTGTELIAHRTFWSGLPGYAKDGVVYVYQRVSSKGGNYNSV